MRFLLALLPQTVPSPHPDFLLSHVLPDAHSFCIRGSFRSQCRKIRFFLINLHKFSPPLFSISEFSVRQPERVQKDFLVSESFFKHAPAHYYIVILQSPISIPLTLHFDVASRHMEFQKKALIHASMIRTFSSIPHGSVELQVLFHEIADCFVCSIFICSIEGQGNFFALFYSQSHDAEDGFAVHGFSVFAILVSQGRFFDCFYQHSCRTSVDSFWICYNILKFFHDFFPPIGSLIFYFTLFSVFFYSFMQLFSLKLKQNCGYHCSDDKCHQIKRRISHNRYNEDAAVRCH